MTREERSWILQDFGNSAYSIAITTALLPVFFKSVAAKGMDGAQSTAYWGYANSIATLIIAVLAPILGSLADYKGYKNAFPTPSSSWPSSPPPPWPWWGGSWLFCLLIYVSR